MLLAGWGLRYPVKNQWDVSLQNRAVPQESAKVLKLNLGQISKKSAHWKENFDVILCQILQQKTIDAGIFSLLASLRRVQYELRHYTSVFSKRLDASEPVCVLYSFHDHSGLEWRLKNRIHRPQESLKQPKNSSSSLSTEQTETHQ